MLGGINPKQMQGMMKKMGMNQEDIPANKVTIERQDGTNIIINNPSIQKITMQGQTSFQITGEETEESPEVGISEADVQTIMDKTGSSREEAEEALEKTGDLAEAIIDLS